MICPLCRLKIWTSRCWTWGGNLRGPIWGGSVCLPMPSFARCWAPSTKSPWTCGPTSSLSKKRILRRCVNKRDTCVRHIFSEPRNFLQQRCHPEEIWQVCLYKWLKARHKNNDPTSFCVYLQKRPVEDSDWRKNVEAMSGMEGRKKMFDAAKGSAQWRHHLHQSCLIACPLSCYFLDWLTFLLTKGFSNFLQQLYFALLMCLGIYVPAVI